MFGKDVTDSASAHFVSVAPEEGCGFVLEVDGTTFFQPLQNRAPDPGKGHTDEHGQPWDREAGFEISTVDFVTHDAHIVGVLHSHVNGSKCPSSADMQGQMAMDKPWGVINIVDDGEGGYQYLQEFWWGDHTLDTPLLGRSFVHGVYDCYALARAYEWQTNSLLLPDCPREDFWWGGGTNRGFMLDHMESMGYEPIKDGTFLKDDAVLMSIKSETPNHCAVHIGGGVILHHLTHRQSSRVPLYPWQKYVTHHLRKRAGFHEQHGGHSS